MPPCDVVCYALVDLSAPSIPFVDSVSKKLSFLALHVDSFLG